MRKVVLAIVTVAVLSVSASVSVHAQFRKEAFQQQYNNKTDSLAMKDSVDKTVDFKEIFGGLAHKREMRIGTMFGTSLILVGASQIYNKEYWKLPIFYTGIAAGITSGIICGHNYNVTGNEVFKQASTWSYVGAGIFYYASLMDGVVNYKADRKPHPGRATIYSILCPGLGQIYNREYWKVPIYVGGLVGSTYFFVINNTNFIRYRDIYREANEPGYSGPITADQAKYYRDEYRRYRDYSLLAIGLFYLLQVIDPNVFAYMNDFEVSNDLSMKMSPTVIMPDEHCFATNMTPATGLSFKLRF